MESSSSCPNIEDATSMCLSRHANGAPQQDLPQGALPLSSDIRPATCLLSLSDSIRPKTLLCIPSGCTSAAWLTHHLTHMLTWMHLFLVVHAAHLPVLHVNRSPSKWIWST